MFHAKAPSYPDERTIEGRPSLFIAGGISGCPDWQSELVVMLQNSDKSSDYVVFNPRRDDFDISKREMSIQQIEWEHHWLSRSETVSFWFPKETLCPITLMELGTLLKSKSKRLFVGAHPAYERLFDLRIQIPLYRPEVKLVYSLEALADQIL